MSVKMWRAALTWSATFEADNSAKSKTNLNYRGALRGDGSHDVAEMKTRFNQFELKYTECPLNISDKGDA